MGWASSADYMQGTHVKFNSKEDAIRFADKQGWSWFVQEPHHVKFTPKSYSNNFRESSPSSPFARALFSSLENNSTFRRESRRTRRSCPRRLWDSRKGLLIRPVHDEQRTGVADKPTCCRAFVRGHASSHPGEPSPVQLMRPKGPVRDQPHSSRHSGLRC